MLNIAKQAAKQAGKILLKKFKNTGQPGVDFRTRQKLVTEADLAAEKRIINIIQKKYPKHHILSEEAGKIDGDSEYQWIIDPLDGTTNFSLGNPFFAVSIGLLKNNEIELGVVYAPFLDEFYYAQKGRGAYLNRKKITVSENDQVNKAFFVFCEGGDHAQQRIVQIYNRLIFQARNVKKLGSAAIECAWVAAGKVDGYFTTQTHPWDVAGGIALIQEAGGVVSDFQGRDWPMNDADFLASNSKLHNYLIKTINQK